jgi:hypothetical protein
MLQEFKATVERSKRQEDASVQRCVWPSTTEMTPSPRRLPKLFGSDLLFERDRH